MSVIKRTLLLVALTILATLISFCSNEEQSNCECKVDEDCEAGFLCDAELCECYRDYNCTRDDECDWESCMSCVNGTCVAPTCESHEDCLPSGRCCFFDDYCGRKKCLWVDCEYSDYVCNDPNSPFYIECNENEKAVMHDPCCENCECRPRCGGQCPSGQYCCRQTQLCDPIPDPCQGVECPPGEQVNPDPGGTLNEETCQVEGADCSCVPDP